jgi:hypothetical protein
MRYGKLSFVRERYGVLIHGASRTRVRVRREFWLKVRLTRYCEQCQPVTAGGVKPLTKLEMLLLSLFRLVIFLEYPCKE